MITAEMSFTEASRLWLESFTLFVDASLNDGRYIKENTEVSYRQYCDSLGLFFGEMPLNTIQNENLKGYQRARLTGAEPFLRYRFPQDARERKRGQQHLPAVGKRPCPAKPKKINQELGILVRIMQEAGAWNTLLERGYRRLLEEEDETQRALEPEQQSLWLRAAASRKEWELVHWYSLLSIGCTLSTNELRYLRVGDINLFHQTLAVAAKGVKCKGRKRVIPLLTADELWAAEQLLERGKECGATQPQHYVFPFRARRGPWDPTKPMSESGIKREWQEVRDATGLAWYRQYDGRHTGCTRLAEDGWHIALIKARAGHITDQMSAHYTHIGEGAQRRMHQRTNTLKFAPRAAAGDGGFDRRVAQ